MATHAASTGTVRGSVRHGLDLETVSRTLGLEPTEAWRTGNRCTHDQPRNDRDPQGPLMETVVSEPDQAA